MQPSIGFPERSRRSERLLACFLAALLALPASVFGQAPQPPAPTVQTLKVIPLSGNNAINDLERRVMPPLVVQVLDQNDRPVEGADVVFRFPVGGATATFANQQTSQSVKTNVVGQARAAGWMMNNQVGSFQVRVTATRGNEQGETLITMTNVTRIADVAPARQGRWWTSKWAIVAYVGAAGAVAAGIVLANRNGGPPTTTITATPGAPTIGGPQ
jgi:hypothetical protein